VRGFYDDNYALTPSSGTRDPFTGQKLEPEESFGYEITPGASLNWAMEQTYIGLGYVYSYKYYENRPEHKADQAHQVNFKLSHAFSDRYKLDIADNFVKTSEPDLMAPSSSPTATIRTRQDVLRNYGAATFTMGLTDQLGLQLGYSNTLYDFSDEGAGSLSALLDRMEHLGTINLRWQVLPSTVALVGYQFGLFDYTGDDNTLIPNPNSPPFRTLFSDERNSRSHYLYVGADHTFNPQLDTSIRVGAQLIEYYNLPGEEEDDVSPFVDANLTYHMTPDSSFQVGVRHSYIATDAAALSQQNTTAYGSLNYRVLPALIASLIGQYQYNTFEHGNAVYQDQSENFFLAGVNLTYEINRFLAAEAGYNYDRLDSDLGFRSFTRNRVYVGLRATY
jgi:hypothetical protein